MAIQRIYEGTPQELAPYLAQRPQGRFRLIELDAEPVPVEPEANRVNVGEGKKLRGMGAFKGKLGGTEALFRDKQVDLAREESLP